MHLSLIPLLLICSAAPPKEAAPAPGPPFDDLVTVYKQTSASLPALRVTFKVEGGSLKEFRDWQKRKLARLEKRWQAASPAEKSEHETEYKKARQMLEMASMEPQVRLREELTIERTLKGVEVRSHLPAKENDPREEEANRRGLKSATGGRFTRYRLDKTVDSPRWVALEPYPFKGTPQPVYTTIVGKLPLTIPMLPPLFGSDAPCDLMFPDVESLCFASPRVGKGHATLSLSEANAQYLLSFLDDSTLIAAAVSLKRGGLPDWMGRFRSVTAATTMVKPARNARMAGLISRYRKQWAVPNPEYVYPTEIVWLEDWKKWDGDLEYPAAVVLRRFDLAMTSDVSSTSDNALTPEKNPPLSVVAMQEFRLEVKSIERLKEATDRTFATEVPMGARLVDYAAGKSVIVGQSDDAAADMLGSLDDAQRERSRRRLLLVVANLVGLAAIGALYWYGRRRGRGDSPSTSV